MEKYMSAFSSKRDNSSRYTNQDAEINKYFDRHKQTGGSPKLNAKFLGDSDRFFVRDDNEEGEEP